MIFRRSIVGSLAILALAAGMATFRADAQTGNPGSSFDARPFGTSKNDPDGGQWFVANVNPGQSKTFQMRLYNPTQKPKPVKLYLSDMLFNASGTPYVANRSTDVGTWGRFETDRVTIPARQPLMVGFSVVVPNKVDPGDHIGAVVIEEAPEGKGNFPTIARVALRIYLTLPGDARKEFEISQVNAARHSVFFPRTMDVKIQLNNTGRVRLEPTVAVDGAPAKGPLVLVSKAKESYTVSRPIHFWGGPMRLHIVALSQSIGLAGPTREAHVIIWVIPWHLITALGLLAGLAFLVRFLLRRRSRKVEALKSDLRRIERLITSQHNGGGAAGTPRDPNAAIRSAIKQARRAGDVRTVERLATMQAEARAAAPDGASERDEARVAIFAAAKQARRAGDIETAKRLETFLAETARTLSSNGQSPPSASHHAG